MYQAELWAWLRQLKESLRAWNHFSTSLAVNCMGTWLTARPWCDLMRSWNEGRPEPQLVYRCNSDGFQHWATQGRNHEFHSHCSWTHPRIGLFRCGAHRRHLCWADHRWSVRHASGNRPSSSWPASLSCWSQLALNVSLVIGVVMGFNWSGFGWLASRAVTSVGGVNKNNHRHDRDTITEPPKKARFRPFTPGV